MSKLLLIRKTLDYMSSGRFFEKAFFIAVRVIAVFTALVGLVLWLRTLSIITRSNNIGSLFGAAVFEVFFIAAIIVVVSILWIRSDDIRNLDADTYKVIPLVQILLKMIGEAMASFTVLVAVGSGLVIWLGGNPRLLYQQTHFLNFFQYVDGSSFIVGLLYMLGGGIWSLLMVTFSYFLSEIIGLLLDVSLHLKNLRRG